MLLNADRRIWAAALVVMAALIAAPGTHAQTPDKTDLDRLVINLHGELDDVSRELADEYLDILEQLQEIVEDYSDYLADLSPEEKKAHPISFKVFTDAFKNGKYAESHEPLLDDVEEFISGLRAVEREHGGGVGMATSQCCRTIRNLRREMSILVDLIEDYAENVSQRKTWDSDIETYLKAAMQGLAVALRLNKEEIIEHLSNQHSQAEALEVLKELEALEGLEGVEAVEALKALRALEGLDIPLPPDVPEDNEWSLRRVPEKRKTARGGDKGLTRSYSANTSVDSRSSPILIINQLGDIQITGWSDNMIEATFDVEVAAGSRVMEERMIARTTLDISFSSGKYLVKADLPTISDPDSRIVSSILSVNLPAANPIICENSSGTVSASGLRYGIDVAARNSAIIIRQVEGKVSARNSMGSVELEDISGPLDISNGYGSIEIADCVGDMDVTNAYALVTLSGCRGDVTLENSGLVEVNDHKGSLVINNAYGKVRVENLDGDLRAVNAYQPIEIYGVGGSARLENMYSKIDVDGVNGYLNINNTYGMIRAENLSGPMDISTANGNVLVILNRRLSGNSTIAASFGTVDLSLNESSGVMLVAKTINGKIKSLLPLSVVREGVMESTQYRFGTGHDSLAVTGNNIAILINDSP